MFFADVSKNDGPSTCSQTWNEPQVCSTLKSTACCCNDSVLSVADLSVAGELKTIFENVQEALESTGAIEIHFPDVIPAIHIEDNEDGTNARNNTGANHPSSSSSSRLARSGKKVSSKKSRPNKRKKKDESADEESDESYRYGPEGGEISEEDYATDCYGSEDDSTRRRKVIKNVMQNSQAKMTQNEASSSKLDNSCNRDRRDAVDAGSSSNGNRPRRQPKEPQHQPQTIFTGQQNTFGTGGRLDSQMNNSHERTEKADNDELDDDQALSLAEYMFGEE